MDSTKLKIFIVHGRDKAPKEALARVIESKGFEAIILDEQFDNGNTIIEKLEENIENVDFGFIIYTSCDEGKIKDGTLKSRARQNVIFEHGYLVGKLGRKSTAILYEKDVEIPSDINGIVYIELDSKEAWKYKVKEVLDNIKPRRHIEEKPNDREEKIKRMIRELDKSEIDILKRFSYENTVILDSRKTGVSGLVYKKILENVPNKGGSPYLLHYSINLEIKSMLLAFINEQRDSV